MVRFAEPAIQALIVGTALALSAPADAQMGGGGGDGGSNGYNDWALRMELQNPKYIEPGSPTGYDRSYSRGPAPWQYPPAYLVPWPPENVSALPPRGHRRY